MDTENLHVHKFRETIVPPTCKETGYTLYTCDCGYEHKGNFKPVVAHSYQTAVTAPASCTEPGQVTATCAVCGAAQTQPTAPLGHDYGYWVVKDYPSCQTPGAQIRKCNRCSETQMSAIRPVGHKCAPGTGRYFKGKLVEFFCENCGQTVQDYPETKIPGYWPTRIMIILTTLLALADLLIKIILEVSPFHNVTYNAPWVSFGMMPFWTVANAFLFFNMRKIKYKDRYTRWLGIIPLAYAALLGSGVVMSALSGNGLNNGWYIYALWSLMIAPLLLLTVVLFTGIKKKYWVFILMIINTLLLFAVVALIMYSNVPLMLERENLSLFCLSSIVGCVLFAFIGLEWTMILFPNKKPAPIQAQLSPYVM